MEEREGIEGDGNVSLVFQSVFHELYITSPLLSLYKLLEQDSDGITYGLKPPDHVVLDDHRNKDLSLSSTPSLSISSTLTELVSYCCRYIL